MELRKAMLWVGIGAISALGLAIAAAFLFGGFNELIMRLMASVVVLGWYGFIMYFSTPPDDLAANGTKGNVLTTLAAICSIAGAVLAEGLIWDFWQVEREWILRVDIILWAWSLTIAWVSLLTYKCPDRNAMRWLSLGTSCILGTATGIFSVLVWNEGFYENEFAVRLMGASAVLGVVGTFIFFLLRRGGTSTAPAQ